MEIQKVLELVLAITGNIIEVLLMIIGFLFLFDVIVYGGWKFRLVMIISFVYLIWMIVFIP